MEQYVSRIKNKNLGLLFTPIIIILMENNNSKFMPPILLLEIAASILLHTNYKYQVEVSSIVFGMSYIFNKRLKVFPIYIISFTILIVNEIYRFYKILYINDKAIITFIIAFTFISNLYVFISNIFNYKTVVMCLYTYKRNAIGLYKKYINEEVPKSYKDDSILVVALFTCINIENICRASLGIDKRLDDSLLKMLTSDYEEITRNEYFEFLHNVKQIDKTIYADIEE